MSTIHEVIPFQELLEALTDEKIKLHHRYLYRLSDLDNKEVALLDSIWTQIPSERRQNLLEALKELGANNLLLSYEAVGRLAILDQDPRVRTLAVQILWWFEPADLIPEFINLLENDPSEQVRAASASALGRFVYLGEVDDISEETQENIEDSLLGVIQSRETDLVKCHSLEAVGYSRRPEIPPLIEAALASGDKEWIKAALAAIGRSIDQRWEEDVLHFLNNKFPAIRAEAARAAGELEISTALPLLIELTEDSNDKVRHVAIWSLSQISGEGVSEILEDLWEEAEEETEIELLEAALDNLEFNINAKLISLFEFPESELDDINDELFNDIDEIDIIENDDEDIFD